MPVNPTPSLSGFIFIDKPTGPTSHDVVANVRAALGGRRSGLRVGHAGTLDPLASGLLILGIGAATKLLSRFVGLDKTYDIAVRLGATSATDDAEGPISKTPNAKPPMPNEVREVIQSFIGEHDQAPPAFSAKKQGGVRLYKLARRGVRVETNPHRVRIYELDIVHYQYPTLTLTIRCSSGTYIRALARDIGRALGVGGYVGSLRRTAIGPFSLYEAIALEKVNKIDVRNLLTPSDNVRGTTGRAVNQRPRPKGTGYDCGEA